MSSTADLPISNTYSIKPSRNSTGYATGSDYSLGMTATTRAPNAMLASPPSAFRTQEITPNFAAPSHPSATRQYSDTSLAPSQSSSSYGQYSASNSPNLNRHSYTLNPGPQAPQPPRPVRSGTLPAGEHPGAGLNGHYANPTYSMISPNNGTYGAPSIPSVPVVPFQSGPLEQSFESKLSLGPTIPVQMGQDAPKDTGAPPTVRARSGTGKSSKDKKSVFGFMSGTFVTHRDTNSPRPSEQLEHQAAGHLDTIRPDSPHSRWFRLQHWPVHWYAPGVAEDS